MGSVFQVCASWVFVLLVCDPPAGAPYAWPKVVHAIALSFGPGTANVLLNLIELALRLPGAL